MRRIQHYDVFSSVYDLTTEPLHRQHRIDAVEMLHLRTGQTVLDVPCGTGANFPFLNLGVGRTGRIVGCDFSPGMLSRARAKIDRAGWGHVTVIESDARLITRDLLATPTIDAVISMLGMTVMPDWEDVFDRTYGLLAAGGRYVVMDLFLEGKRTSRFADRFFSIVANADSTRRFWEPLEGAFPRLRDPRLSLLRWRRTDRGGYEAVELTDARQSRSDLPDGTGGRRARSGLHPPDVGGRRCPVVGPRDRRIGVAFRRLTTPSSRGFRMFTPIHGLPDSVVGFTVQGKIHTDDYRTTLIPAVEDLIDRTGTARVLVVLGPEWEGISASAMFEDTKLGLEHWKAWERLALVSDAEWIHHLASLFGWMVPGEVQVFGVAALDEATAWVSS